jgi:hypothetical protein
MESVNHLAIIYKNCDYKIRKCRKLTSQIQTESKGKIYSENGENSKSYTFEV